MTRIEWRAEYRRARATERFLQYYGELTGKTSGGTGPESMYSGLPCGFSFTRLFGDHLGVFPLNKRFGSRLHSSLRAPVRLPA